MGLLAPSLQLLFWRSASHLALFLCARVRDCVRVSHGLTKTYLRLTFHTAHQRHHRRSRCTAQSVSRCTGFVRKRRYKSPKSSDGKNSPARRRAEGEPTGSAASPSEGAAEALSWRAATRRVHSSASVSRRLVLSGKRGVGGGGVATFPNR